MRQIRNELGRNPKDSSRKIEPSNPIRQVHTSVLRDGSESFQEDNAHSGHGARANALSFAELLAGAREHAGGVP